MEWGKEHGLAKRLVIETKALAKRRRKFTQTHASIMQVAKKAIRMLLRALQLGIRGKQGKQKTYVDLRQLALGGQMVKNVRLLALKFDLKVNASRRKSTQVMAETCILLRLRLARA